MFDWHHFSLRGSDCFPLKPRKTKNVQEIPTIQLVKILIFFFPGTVAIPYYPESPKALVISLSTAVNSSTIFQFILYSPDFHIMENMLSTVDPTLVVPKHLASNFLFCPSGLRASLVWVVWPTPKPMPVWSQVVWCFISIGWSWLCLNRQLGGLDIKNQTKVHL